MDWRHEVSTEWLKARRNVITATELVGLKAGFTKLTKAQKAGTQVAPAFAALWGQKHSMMDPDPKSYGAAARGHILEPYAVQDYSIMNKRKWHHWDDCIICNNGVGFSPDAMDIEQVHNDVMFNVSKGIMKSDDGMHAYTNMPTSILEIKSYGIENHMKNIVTPKNQLKERYQIAVAMMVIPTLKEGRLIQYCPQLDEWSMFEKVYTREDLEDEIAEMSEILDVWNKTCMWFNSNQSEMEASTTEADIYQEYIASLPPEPTFKL